MTTLKCVAVGDAAVGKTCLLVAYATNSFTTEYEPTTFQTYHVTVDIGSKPSTLTLVDTAGKEEYEFLTPVECPHTNVFLVCFSVMSPESMENAKEKWIPYVKEACPNTPYFLVGTKIDVRDDPDSVLITASDFVTTKHGAKMAKRVKAVDYIECSALTQKGIHKLFNRAITTAINPPKRRKRKSCLGKS